VLTNVKLNNEETLNLSFQVAKATGAAQQLNYNLDVYDKDTKNLVLSMTLDGSQIHSYETRGTISAMVTRFTYDSDGQQTSQELGNYDILAWIDTDGTIRVVLDAADIQATSVSYLNALKGGLKEENAAKTDFAGTYSFHRFGVDADNIYCTIQGVGDGYQTTAMKQSNDQAVYFATANVDVVDNGQGTAASYSYIYTLENGRHLYNVRFVEDLTNTLENQYSDFIESDDITHQFEVSEDIDWNSFVAGGNLYYTKSGSVEMGDAAGAEITQITATGGSDCVRLLTQCDFPSIKQLRYGDTFTGSSQQDVNTTNREISGLSIVETSNVLCGVYTTATTSNPTTGSLVGEEGNDDTAGEDLLSQERPVGLFVRNYGTITKLNLNQITVEGREKVGAFCGTNQGNLADLEVKSSTENPSTVTGQENVGGIMGYEENINDSGLYGGNAKTSELTGLINRAKVTGRLYVGGIVGQVHVLADSSQAAVVIDKCENYGVIVACNSEALKDADTREAKTEPGCLGGIVGYANNEYVNGAGKGVPDYLIISNCSSSPEYSEEDLDLFMERDKDSKNEDIDQLADESYKGTNLRGVYVGGIVGFNSDGIVEKCGTENPENKTGYVFGYQYVGGIVGFNQGIIRGTEENSTTVKNEGVNEINVVGWQYVGGISGSNTDLLKEENSDETLLEAHGLTMPKQQSDLLVEVSNWENRGVIFAKDSYAGGIAGENDGSISGCTDNGDVSSPNGDCGGVTAWNYEGGKIADCQVMAPEKKEFVTFTAKENVGGVASHNQGDITGPKLTSVYVCNNAAGESSNIGVVVGKNYSTGVITLAKGNAVENCKAETYTDNSNVGGVVGLNLGTLTAPKWYQKAKLDKGQEDLTQRTFDKPETWVSSSVGYGNDKATMGDLGGVAGENQGIIENIGVNNSTVTGKLGSTATGIGGVAGVSVPAAGTNVSGGKDVSSGKDSSSSKNSSSHKAAAENRAVTEKPRIENCTFDGEVSAEGTKDNIIYMGGIVGLNQQGSTIYGCRVGVKNKTVISNGDIKATTSYGYVGGIAGNTYGDVVACDSYHTDNTSVEVLIETNGGQAGGVAGVQQTGAKVTGEQNRRLSTGKDWTVSYYQYIDEEAIGGIVGSSYSNEALEYISNYATALYVGDTSSEAHYNMARAGLVGRLCPASTKSVRFTYCYNYGSVLGKTTMKGTTDTSQGQCGGIIGQLQSAGVTMEFCKNYGTIRGGHNAGGMIGTIYMPMADVEIFNCENHGNLYGDEAAAGMVASRYKKGSADCDFVFYQCVNTGVVGTSDNAATRSGMGTVPLTDTPDTNITGYYAQCQNYGYGNGGSSFSGMQNGIEADTIMNCFDLGGGQFSEVENSDTQTGNFFMNRDSFTSDETARGNEASTRFNFKDGALYLGGNITSIQNLTVLSNGSEGANAYYGETSQEYVIGGEAEEQNIRYRTYLEMHTKIADYIKSTYCLNNIPDKLKLDAPANVQLNYRTEAGYSTLTWDKVEQAYSYEIKYTVTKNDGTTVTKKAEMEGLCRLHIEGEELEDASNLRVKIRAKDGCGNHSSDWTQIDFQIQDMIAVSDATTTAKNNADQTQNDDDVKPEQPKTEQAETEQPETEQPKTEQAETEQPETEQPETEQAETEQPKAELPGTEQSKTEQVETE
jgi:hypothetical protein